MAKPFVKWAGGKGKLLPVLEANLPVDFEEQKSVTYIEPFVGGGLCCSICWQTIKT